MTWLLWFGALTSAEAASDLVVKSKTPVLVFVNGKQANLSGQLTLVAEGVEAGQAEVRVTGLFGKALYETKLELNDYERVEAEWRGGELVVTKRTPLPGAPPPSTSEPTPELASVASPVEPAEAEGLAPVEPLVGETPTPAADGAAPAVADAPPPAPLPLPEAAPPEAAPPPSALPPEAPGPAAPEPAPVLASALVPITAAPPRTLSLGPPPGPGVVKLTAQEGSRFEIAHREHRLVILVQDGSFVVEDEAGQVISMGPPPPPAVAPGIVRLVPTDGHPASVLVDDKLVATLEPGQASTQLSLPPGSYLLELRDPTSGRRLHRGIATVTEGGEFELHYGATEAKVALGDPTSFRAL